MVDEVGDGITGVSVGDDVFGRGQNTQAEYAAAGVADETSERGLRLLDVEVPFLARRLGLRVSEVPSAPRSAFGRVAQPD